MMATSTFALATSSNCAAVVPGTQCLRAGGGGWTKKIESGPAVESLGACCDACSNHSQCKAFEIIREHGKSTNGCWLVDSFRQKDDPLANCSSAPAQLPPRPDAVSGVWMQHGSLFDMTNLTFLRGGDLFYTWAELETSNGTWDFSNMDSDLALAAGAGFKVVVAIMVGPMSPKWIYDAPFNVPDVKMQGEGGNYPYYLDETYQELFMRAVRTFAEHITSLPSELRSRIVAAQPQFGSTGDDCPWHPTPKDPKYDISTDQWHNFTMSYSPDVCAAYKAANVRCLWNTHIDLLEKLLALCPGSYIKAGMVSHGFQVNFEADNYEEKGAICHAEDEHCRGESWPFMVEGYWLEAPVWSTYWHLLWQLTFGVDMPQLSQPSLVNPDFAPYYEFFNKYAASVRPPANKWVGGFVALRDGLDSANWTRFPNETFGDAKQRNIDRLKAIRDAFKSRGAKLGDPVAASSAAMHSRERNSTNDVGWRIWQVCMHARALTHSLFRATADTLSAYRRVITAPGGSCKLLRRVLRWGTGTWGQKSSRMAALRAALTRHNPKNQAWDSQLIGGSGVGCLLPTAPPFH